MESVLPLHAKDAELAKASMLKLISLIVAGGRTAGQKRERCEWTPEANPAKLAKCRSLTRYPTGQEMPDYKRSL